MRFETVSRTGWTEKRLKPLFSAAWWIPSESIEVRQGLWSVGVTVGMTMDVEGIVQSTNSGRVAEQTSNVRNDLVPVSGKWVVAPIPASEKRETFYEPLAQRSLHRTFSETTLDERGVVSFASRHGFLFEEAHVLWTDPGTNDIVLAQPLAEWLEAILIVRTILRLWDLTREQGGHLELRRLISLSGHSARLTPSSLLRNGESVEVPNRLLLELDMEERPAGGDYSLLEAAKTLTVALLNDLLETEVRAVLAKSGSGSKALTVLRLVPYDLFGAILILLADEIMGRQKQPVKCQGCGAYFTPSRSDQRHCHPECRLLKHRAKVREKKEENA